MTEYRRFAGHGFGHAGYISYTSNNNTNPRNSAPGSLHTQRLTSDSLHLRFAGLPTELLPPSRVSTPPLSSRKWQQRHDQGRWLLMACPEASMGNSVAKDYVKEDLERFGTTQETTDRSPLLAFGEINTVLDRNRNPCVPVLAVAAGESGQMLRIVRVDESKWKWDDSQDFALNISMIESEDREDRVLGTSDGLPISQVKFAISASMYEPLRWLLVQKETSTTILQPEYHQVPVAESRLDPITQAQALSRINPNPIVSISHHETGGNAHVDMVLNPAGDGNHRSIIVLDECGYWTLWDIVGSTAVGSKGFHKRLLKRGHWAEGLSRAGPSPASYSAERRGAMIVGGQPLDGFWVSFTDDRPNKEALTQSQARSQYILFWDNERFVIFDLRLNVFLPELGHFTATRGHPDYILDIQQSPVNINHVLVLTREWLFLVDALSKQDDTDATPRPRVLLASPHLGSLGGDVMMTVCAAEYVSPSTSLILLYSPQALQLCVFWIQPVTGQVAVRLHRQACVLPALDQEPPLRKIRQLLLKTTTLCGLDGKLKASRLQEATRFYQLTILTDNLEVRYCITFTTPDQNLYLEAPTLRAGWTKQDQSRRWKMKRKHFLRRLGKAFVLPDGMSEKDLNTVVLPAVMGNAQLRRTGETSTVPRKQHPLHLKVRRFCHALQAQVAEQVSYQRTVSTALLDAVRQVITHGTARGGLSLVTWQDIYQDFGLLQQPGTSASEEEIQALLKEATDDVVVTRLDPMHADDASVLPGPDNRFARMWLDAIQDAPSGNHESFIQNCITRLSHDMLLSTIAVMVSNVSAFRDFVIESEAERLGEGQTHYQSSQPSSSTFPSSPPEISNPAAADPVLQRLSLLAVALNPLPQFTGNYKVPQVLAQWPKERGVSTQDYISSVASQTEKQFDEAKQRLKRKEAKRKAQAEKYKRPAFMRQGFPEVSEPVRTSSQSQPSSRLDTKASTRSTSQVPIRSSPVPAPAPLFEPQIMTSQSQVPPSSQSQGIWPSVTMSQPIAGAFGDRKKAKKAKKKSGFR